MGVKMCKDIRKDTLHMQLQELVLLIWEAVTEWQGLRECPTVVWPGSDLSSEGSGPPEPATTAPACGHYTSHTGTQSNKMQRLSIILTSSRLALPEGVLGDPGGVCISAMSSPKITPTRRTRQ
ncbi:hypothetical protein SRHO_G00306140 [Serrasalmus rhombeus]